MEEHYRQVLWKARFDSLVCAPSSPSLINRDQRRIAFEIHHKSEPWVALQSKFPFNISEVSLCLVAETEWCAPVICSASDTTERESIPMPEDANSHGVIYSQLLEGTHVVMIVYERA